MTMAAAHLGTRDLANAQSRTTPPADRPTMKPGTHVVRRPEADRCRRPACRLRGGWPAAGPAVILLHGWPYDIYSYVDVAPVLAAAGYRVIVPYLRGYGTTLPFQRDARNGQQSVLAVIPSP